MAHRPVGSGVSFTTSTTSSKSAAFSGRTNTLRLVATGANAFVAIGTEPTATTSDYCIPSGTSVTLAIDNGSAKIVGITTGTITYIDFPEGQASPFGIGDYVSLTASNQTYYNFNHYPVVQVYNTSNYEGYFSTRIGIATDTSGIATAFADPDTTLRNSIKVAAITDTGSGILYTQQVQITGQA
jgi:hypothetical protein